MRHKLCQYSTRLVLTFMLLRSLFFCFLLRREMLVSTLSLTYYKVSRHWISLISVAVMQSPKLIIVIWGPWTLNPWTIKVYQSIKYHLLNRIIFTVCNLLWSWHLKQKRRARILHIRSDVLREHQWMILLSILMILVKNY